MINVRLFVNSGLTSKSPFWFFFPMIIPSCSIWKSLSKIFSDGNFLSIYTSPFDQWQEYSVPIAGCTFTLQERTSSPFVVNMVSDADLALFRSVMVSVLRINSRIHRYDIIEMFFLQKNISMIMIYFLRMYRYFLFTCPGKDYNPYGFLEIKKLLYS